MEETNTVKRRVLWELSLALAGNFFLLPFVLLVGALTPAYERTRVVNGMDLAFVLALYSSLAFVLWPTRSADAFKSFGDASTYASMLGLDDGSGDAALLAPELSGSGGASLDEAYAYTSSLEPSGRVQGSYGI
jgi:hypothetical protein